MITNSVRPLLADPAASDLAALDVNGWHAACADRDLPLQERLDAFEDVMESEVGDTLFTRARNLERRFGLRQLWLKFEGDNPTGTQKDRIAFAHTADALRRGYSTITVATCGNYGVAMALATRVAGIACRVIIPEPYHTRRIAEMEQLGAVIERVGQTYEDAVAASSARAAEHDWYDANPGGINEVVQLRAYGEMASEIYDQLRDAPALVACPMSNGTTLAGLHRGFKSLYRRGKTSRMPRIVGGSAYRKNPIVTGFEQGLSTCPQLDAASIRETVVNEPLINWHSIDGDAALAALHDTNGHALGVTDTQMRQMARLLRDQQALSVLPASTAGLVALLRLHEQTPLPPDRYVVLLTGRSS